MKFKNLLLEMNLISQLIIYLLKSKNSFLGYKFNQPIDKLPVGLESLTLSKNYDKPLNNLLTSVKITRK